MKYKSQAKRDEEQLTRLRRQLASLEAHEQYRKGRENGAIPPPLTQNDRQQIKKLFYMLPAFLTLCATACWTSERSNIKGMGFLLALPAFVSFFAVRRLDVD